MCWLLDFVLQIKRADVGNFWVRISCLLFNFILTARFWAQACWRQQLLHQRIVFTARFCAPDLSVLTSATSESEDRVDSSVLCWLLDFKLPIQKLATAELGAPWFRASNSNMLTLTYAESGNCVFCSISCSNVPMSAISESGDRVDSSILIVLSVPDSNVLTSATPPDCLISNSWFKSQQLLNRAVRFSVHSSISCSRFKCADVSNCWGKKNGWLLDFVLTIQTCWRCWIKGSC